MKFKFIQFLLIIFSLLILPKFIVAVEPNNKFGIHLAQPHFDALEETAELVNSSGGDWGYVTLVIQENDRKIDKWQEIFNRLRKLHLIPIVRLATQPEGEVWRRPKKEDAAEWVEFLDKLNWVIRERYVILFNEPNHGSEWGGEVDAEDYARTAFRFAKKLKEKKPDFFVMLAGLDASAPQSPPVYEDEEAFLRKIFKFQFPTSKQLPNNQSPITNNIFDFIDGWSSHSYPNPDFSASPWDSGRGSIRTYRWEREFLRNLGMDKDLPVFITETGWVRRAQSEEEQRTAENYRAAYESVWLPDERVRAVTPFVLDYQSQPFLDFSWKKQNSREFYQQFYTVQSINKVKGEPEQTEKGKIEFVLPSDLVARSNYQFKIRLKNLGQAVWDKDDGYELRVRGYELGGGEYLVEDLKNIQPFEEKSVSLFLKTGKETDKVRGKIVLEKSGKKIIESKPWRLTVLPLPSMKFNVNLYPKLNDRGDDFEIQLFDEEQNVVFKKNKVTAFGGKGELTDIQNVIVGRRYRMVILKPYYLPRQNFITLKKDNNETKFKIMMPMDFDADGRLSFNDLISLLKQPQLLRLFIP